MAFLPLAQASNFYILKNGQLIESSVTLNFFRTLADMSAEWSRILTNDDMAHKKDCIYRNPPGTNPQIIFGELTTAMTEAATISPICHSDTFGAMLTNLNDEIIFYNMDYGNAIGFGLQYYQQISATIKQIRMFTITPLGRTYSPGYNIGYTGSGADMRRFVMYLGVMIDTDAKMAYPFCIQGAYYWPLRTGDNVRVQSLETSGATLRTIEYAMYNLFGNVPPEPPEPSDDPYSGGGYSTGTDTPTGTFDDSSEDVDLPLTYGMTPCNVGLVSQYAMTPTQVADFASWLWNPNSVLDDLKRIFTSPFDAIISIGMLPYTPSDTTLYNVKLGTLDVTGCTGKLVNDPVDKISMGSITFSGYYGSALDFNPYTKIEMYLPYCGTITLNPDEVMNHTISVEYYIDSLSGDIDAFISDEKRVLQIIKGNCFVPIPLTGRDFSSVYSSALGAVSALAVGAGAAVATGGMSAPIAVGMGTSVAANALNAKEQIKRVSSLGGMSGFMSIQNVYVIMTVPRQCLPELQNDHQGYPLFVTKALKEFSGYTEVYEIHLDGLDCTDEEMKEIYNLLKGGVIL